MLKWIRQKLFGRSRTNDDFAFRIAQKVFSSVTATSDGIAEYAARRSTENGFSGLTVINVELAAFFLHWVSRAADTAGKREAFTRSSAVIVEELFLFLCAQNVMDLQRIGREAFRELYFERLNRREQELGALQLGDDPEAREAFLGSVAGHIINSITPFFAEEYRADKEAHDALLTQMLQEMFS